MARLVFIRARRALTGKYVLRAKNEHGEDAAEVDIQVLGKPAAPAGPLEVSDVTKKTCLLRWGPSEDDGGFPITNYEVIEP